MVNTGSITLNHGFVMNKVTTLIAECAAPAVNEVADKRIESCRGRR